MGLISWWNSVTSKPVVASSSEPLPVQVSYGDAGSLVSSVAYEASRVLKNSEGRLLHLSGYSSKASAQFIQIHDAAAVPADAAVPKAILQVAANSPFEFKLPLNGAPFSNGIVVCNSSTGPTKTVGAADCWFTAEVV